MGDDLIGSDLIRGHIDTIILRALMDGDGYGYEIIKRIGALSLHEYELKEPSLYTALRRLEAAGFISSYWGGETNGGRRKYYRITDEGEKEYRQSLEHWEKARELINRLLGLA